MTTRLSVQSKTGSSARKIHFTPMDTSKTTGEITRVFRLDNNTISILIF